MNELFTPLLLILAVLLANLPFLLKRRFYLRALAEGQSKSVLVLIAELLLGFLLMGGVSMLLEQQAHGSVYPQHWEFYAVAVCVFVVLGFPGFVVRYLWRQHV